MYTSYNHLFKNGHKYVFDLNRYCDIYNKHIQDCEDYIKNINGKEVKIYTKYDGFVDDKWYVFPEICIEIF